MMRAFRGSYLNVWRMLTNFGIGPLARCSRLAEMCGKIAQKFGELWEDRRTRSSAGAGEERRTFEFRERAPPGRRCANRRGDRVSTAIRYT